MIRYLGAFIAACCCACSADAQRVGINTIAPDPAAALDVTATNKGVLIPRIDFNNRPVNAVVSGMMIYVTANGPAGNNAFYYYNGSGWVKVSVYSPQSTLSLSNDTLSISPGNSVAIGNVFPLAGYIKCGAVYINPMRNNSHCGGCNQPCASPRSCVNGSCQ